MNFFEQSFSGFFKVLGIFFLVLLFTLPTFGFERFKNGMVYSHSDIDQIAYRSCSGNLYGLKDDNGKIILPQIYSDIEYCGHSIFLATDVQKWNKYYFGDKRHFFNRDGVELKYRLPSGAYLFNIFSFGHRADKSPDLMLTELAEDTILLFGYRDEPERRKFDSPRQGLCNINGEILFQPIRGKILFFKPGKAIVFESGKSGVLVDLKTWKIKPTKLEWNPGHVPPARIPRPSNYQVAMPFPKDRIRTTISTDDGHFDSIYWRTKRNYPISRQSMFTRFLKDYNLIGMSKDRVAVLLGETEQLEKPPPYNVFVYIFPLYSCMGDRDGIKIYFKNERVSSWSFFYVRHSSGLKESQRITKNVVFKSSKRKPKIGERGVEERFPETVEK